MKKRYMQKVMRKSIDSPLGKEANSHKYECHAYEIQF